MILLLDYIHKDILIEKYVIEHLENITNIEFLCYFTLFINVIPNIIDIEESLFLKFLIKRSILYYPLASYLLTQLHYVFVTTNNYKFCIFKNLLLDKLTQQLSNELLKTEEIFGYIENHLCKKNIKEGLIDIHDYLDNKNSFYLPTNPLFRCKKMNILEITIKASSQRPFMIPCQIVNIVDEVKQYHLLYKQEDLSKDQCVMNIIILIDMILKKETYLDLHITKYSVVPLSDKAGLIEIIPNAHTIHSILKSKFTIQNFILEHNPNITIHKLRERFMKSCAAYCVISYILGIGDRHLENIMITESGYLFHIDFDYILGYDPKPLAPEIRITPEMIDAIGGENSIYYTEFKNICTKAYNCLRRHADLLVCMLCSLKEFPPSIIKEHISQRLMVGENEEDATLNFVAKVIKNSSTSYSTRLIDFFHKSKKDTLLLI